MWQCHTYSQPKFLTSLTTVAGLPVSGSTCVKPVGTPSSCDGSIGRTLNGRPNPGVSGFFARMATMMSSSGCIFTVSFQPSSFGIGGFTVPSQPTRLITCTL
jgi:hypothetical protein